MLRGVQPGGLMDEENLLGHISLRQPPHLPVPNHLDDLVTLDCSAGSVEGSKALPIADPPFHGAVVLLHDIVLVGGGATPAAPPPASAPASVP